MVGSEATEAAAAEMAASERAKIGVSSVGSWGRSGTAA